MRATLFSGDSSDLELRAIRNQSERFENEYLDSSNSFLPEYQNLNEITTAPWDVQASLDTFEHCGGTSKLLKNEKVQRMMCIFLFNGSLLFFSQRVEGLRSHLASMLYVLYCYILNIISFCCSF